MGSLARPRAQRRRGYLHVVGEPPVPQKMRPLAEGGAAGRAHVARHLLPHTHPHVWPRAVASLPAKLPRINLSRVDEACGAHLGRGSPPRVGPVQRGGRATPANDHSPPRQQPRRRASGQHIPRPKKNVASREARARDRLAAAASQDEAEESDATEEEAARERTTRVGRPRGGMKVACSENRRGTAKRDRKRRTPKGGRRLAHHTPLLKIPVWWRRAVLPSLPWLVCFLSFFL